jgi:acyl-CoA reductase-like NAD-dependent aldehyde dehydrogenase
MSEPHSFKTFNPLKNRFNPQVFRADTVPELENKIQLAADAEGILSATSFKKISSFLLEIKSQLITRKNKISSAYLDETGLNKS